jgi:hypothetical protein
MKREAVLAEAQRTRIAVNLVALTVLVVFSIWLALAGASAPHVHLACIPLTSIVAFYAGTIRGAATMVINALGGPDA